MELREPFDGPRTFITHSTLERWLEAWQRDNQKLTKDSVIEFWKLINRILAHGKARQSVALFEYHYGADQRKRFQKMLRDCPYLYIVANHCAAAGRLRCRTWGLKEMNGLERWREPGENETDAPRLMLFSDVKPYWRVAEPWRGAYTVSAEWLRIHALRWREYCLSSGLPVCYDFDGSTPYGGACFRSLDCVVLPASVNWADFPGSDGSLRWSKRFLRKLWLGDVPRLCVRIWGRLYHPLINVSRWLRRMLRFRFRGQVEAAREVDMSCTYWVILVSMMPPCAERDELWRLLSGVGDFYTELNAACSRPYATRDEAKEHTQEQCLFWINWWYESEQARPLWLALNRRFPRLAAFIHSFRSRLNGTYFSDMLTRAESSFFVDHLLVMVEGLGIPAVPIHDCLVVPESACDQVLDLCRQEAGRFFGFVPKFGVK